VIRLLAAGFAALALAGSALAGSAIAASPPRQADLEAEIVCPTCKTTLDQSNSPIATRMKAFIRARIAAGDSAAQIKASLVDQFGPAVLAEPPKRGFDLLAWLLPLAALGLGIVVVGALAWTWSRRRESDVDLQEAGGLDPDLERRVDEELSRYED
jgi:cytochrome c-type biogenesis protein CcmH